MIVWWLAGVLSEGSVGILTVAGLMQELRVDPAVQNVRAGLFVETPKTMRLLACNP